LYHLFRSVVLSPHHTDKTTKRQKENHLSIVLFVFSSHKTTERDSLKYRFVILSPLHTKPFRNYLHDLHYAYSLIFLRSFGQLYCCRDADRLEAARIVTGLTVMQGCLLYIQKPDMKTLYQTQNQKIVTFLYS
jgi:hypothetical protein